MLSPSRSIRQLGALEPRGLRPVAFTCLVFCRAVGSSYPRAGGQCLVKAVSKGYIVEQRMQQKIIQDHFYTATVDD